MEELFYFLLFAVIVGVNMLIKNKGFSGEKLPENPDLPEVSPEIQQVKPKIADKNLKKTQNPEVITPQKIEIQPKKFNFNKKSMRDAVIMKEILDSPLALR